MHRRFFAALRMTSFVLVLTACEIEKVPIPRTDALLALHGVLSATAIDQAVLLERTRNGSVLVFGDPFDLSEPVAEAEGIVENDAFVRLVTPVGDTLVAGEDRTKAGGIYRFALAGDQLERNGEYDIEVVTTRGEILTATTSVPDGTAAMGETVRAFDRSRDTVVMEWPASSGARSYFVRVETPFGPRAFFTDSTRVRFTGELRNPDQEDLRHVFIPGFPQAVTVSAVDANYYDWFRTHNDVVSGTGLTNRVSGGLGVFGSVVRLRFEQFDVVAPQTEPVSGTFGFVRTGVTDVSRYTRLNLYIESHSARSDQADALSGNSIRQLNIGESGCSLCGVLGTTRNGHIQLALLGGWFAKDTVEVFTGETRGDTIVGSYRGLGGHATFVRQP